VELFDDTISTSAATSAGLDASSYQPTQDTQEKYDDSTDTRGRSNIIGSSTYDPLFAAQGKVDRGIFSNFQDAFGSTYQPSNENIFSGIYNALPTVSSPAQTMFSTDQVMKDLSNKGLENSTDVRNYFIQEAGGNIQTGLNAYGNFLGGLGISKTNPYGEGASKLSDLGVYGLTAATLLGEDEQANFPNLSSYDAVDLANKNLDFLMQGGKPKNFGSVSGVVDKAKQDFTAAGQGISSVLDEARNYLTNSNAGIDTTNINMNLDSMPGGRTAFVPDFEVTRPVSNVFSEGDKGGDVYSEGIFTLDPKRASEIMDEPMLNFSIAPSRAREAAESMIDREQLIPKELDLANIPEEELGMTIAPGSRDNRFKFMTSTGADLLGSNPMTPNYMNVVDYENLAEEMAKLKPYERDFLAGKTNTAVGAPFNFITQQDLINRQMS
jgi:hypothetical protein